MTHTSSRHSAVTLSVRIQPEIRDHRRFSRCNEKTKSYLATQAWQIKALKRTIKKADSKDAKFIDHDKVVEWLTGWGTEEEYSCSMI